MGCDIHLYCEVYNTIDGVSTWRTADRFKYDYYNEEYEVDNIYSNRNYRVFTALAGVRSYGNGCVPISEPRGLPCDICSFVKKEKEEWGFDGHSHSYCTLKELYEYQDEHKTITYKGMVSPEDAVAIDSRAGTPSTWYQATTDNTWVYREWTVEGSPLGDLMDAVNKRAMDEFLIFYKDRVPDDLSEKFRIVFWFDN